MSKRGTGVLYVDAEDNFLSSTKYSVQGRNIHHFNNSRISTFKLSNGIVYICDKTNYLFCNSRKSVTKVRWHECPSNNVLWEYNTPKDSYILYLFHSIIRRNDRIYFFEESDNIEKLKELNIENGVVLNELEAIGSEIYDTEKGKTYKLKTVFRTDEKDEHLIYSIVDIEKMSSIQGEIYDERINYVMCSHGIQAFSENKLFFSNIPRSTMDNLRPANFGCFDLNRHEVVSTHDLPESDATDIRQMITLGREVYILTSMNNLYIYEHEL